MIFSNRIMDRQTLKEILQVTCGVLHTNFFYEKERVIEFLDNFTEILKCEIILFTETVEPEIINDLLTYSRCAFLFYLSFREYTFTKNIHRKITLFLNKSYTLLKMSYLNTREISRMKSQQNIRERIIENFLYKYPTYKIGVKNCQKQLDYMLPIALRSVMI